MAMQSWLKKLSQTRRLERYCRNSKSEIRKIWFPFGVTGNIIIRRTSVMIRLEAIAQSGERTRLACWRWRPRHRDGFEGTIGCGSFGEVPKGAREGACAPRT